jgi:hypothetical protein
MRQLIIDELNNEEREKLIKFLKRTAEPGPIADIFWLPLPPDLWSEDQQSHVGCAPFSFAIEVNEAAVSFELLVRSQAALHCSCIRYATGAQRDFLLAYIDRLVNEEGIRA